MIKYIKTKNIYLITTLLLYACGGGGGGGGGGGEGGSTAIAGAKIISIDRTRDILHGETVNIKVNIRETKIIAAAATSPQWRVRAAGPHVDAKKTGTDTLAVTNRSNSADIVDQKITITDENNNELASFEEKLYPPGVTTDRKFKFVKTSGDGSKVTKNLFVANYNDIAQKMTGALSSEAQQGPTSLTVFEHLLTNSADSYKVFVFTKNASKEIKSHYSKKIQGTSNKKRLRLGVHICENGQITKVFPLQGTRKTDFIFTAPSNSKRTDDSTVPSYITDIHSPTNSNFTMINSNSMNIIGDKFNSTTNITNNNNVVNNPSEAVSPGISGQTQSKVPQPQALQLTVNHSKKNLPIANPLAVGLCKHHSPNFTNYRTADIADENQESNTNAFPRRETRSSGFAVPSIQTYSYGKGTNNNITSSLSDVLLAMRTRVNHTVIYFTVQNKLKNYARLSGENYNHTTVKYHALFADGITSGVDKTNNRLVTGKYSLRQLAQNNVEVNRPMSISAHDKKWSGPDNDPILRKLVAGMGSTENDVIISTLTNIKSASNTPPAELFIDKANMGVTKIITVHILLGDNPRTTGNSPLSQYLFSHHNPGDIANILKANFTDPQQAQVFDQTFKNGLIEYRRQVLEAHGLSKQEVAEKIKAWDNGAAGTSNIK